MNKKLLAKNLRESPLVPNQYATQVLAAIGGTVELGDATSRQGGTNISSMRWENGTPIHVKSDILNINFLISFCRRKRIFYVISPSLDEKKIMTYVTLDGRNSACTGVTLEGTFAAALVLLLGADDEEIQSDD